jgi:5-methylcytosine-specific restriction protein B
MNNNNFNWVNFYMEFADKLMSHKNDRDALIQKIKNAFDGINPKLPTLERDNNIIDIDPFTVFGLFNKGLTDVNRIEILKAFAKGFNIKSTVPSSFNGIPVLNNQLATFYWFAGSRGESDIQNLWDIFESAIKYSKKNSIRNKNKLIESFNKVIVQKGIKWNLTMGLYWIRPYDFISLDSRNRWYICNSGKSLKTLVESFAGFKNMPNGEEYLDIIETCKEVLSNEGYKDNDFPAFSYDAWLESERVNEENRKKKKEKVDLSDGAEWFPNDYTPGISVDDWIALLNDPEVFSPSSLEIMKRMKDIGGIATCKQLSQKYGESVNFYISGSAYLGKRIFEKTNCLIEKRGEKKNKYWPILYLGRDNDGAENDGVFMWKLRSELSEALDKVDLSNVSLHAPLKKAIPCHEYTRDDFLREVYISPEKYDSLVRLLKRKKNVILQGAPGVGKTYIAKRLAYSMMAERDESCIEMVQFHQSYSYDDFVRGYKPNETSFEIKDGIFYLFCKKALENPTKDYFFIIDEINRGNLSKIFGELLMLIECDHRGESLKLSVGGEDFKVPENVYIIGMMNTADRSLALIDYALRRRFGFVEIEPGFKSVGFKKVCEKFGNQKLDALIQLVEKLNSKIEKDSSLGKGFCIGHSYFCFNDTPCTDESLSCIVKHDILPMLNEYWFDDRDSYEEWEKEFAKWEENLKVESE